MKKKIKLKKIRGSNGVSSETKKPTIKKMKLNELIPADYNPRKISKDAFQGLKKSVERFGLVQPIIYNEAKNRIVGGHQRLKVLQDQGVEEVDVVVVHIEDDDEEKALNVTLNNPKITGEFDGSVDIFETLRDTFPDLYDGLNIRMLHDDILNIDQEKEEEEEEESGDEHEIPKMELLPFEHYDYVLVLAKDNRDWQNLQEQLNLQKVDCSPITSRKKIGLGRCISAKTLLKILEDKKND